MGLDIGSILGGGLASTVKGIVGAFKLDPEKKAEFEAAVDEHAAEFKLAELQLQSKVQDAMTAEIQTAAANIQSESNSQSWIPRNVRPLLLLLWGCLITFNPLVAIITQFTAHPMTPIVLDSWIYKLTAIGFTGYSTLRTFEKWKDAD